MDNFLSIIYWVVTIIFFVCYTYQFIYLVIPFIVKEKPHKDPVLHRFAVLISARNEAKVIRQLIESIKNQDYPQDKIDIFVMADNCTDSTYETAFEAGAYVYKRDDLGRIGKGYALNLLLKNIAQDFGEDAYDAYFVFDADNVLEPDYITQMNKTFSDGYNIITSYRNSKNFGANWISAGYGLWFLRESRYLNEPRMLLNTSCAVGGTGFMFSNEIIKKSDGWNFYLLTEDIEFSIYNIIDGEKIGYCKDAVFYDEQPTKIAQSWRQRQRWSKGFLQVFRKYGLKLYKGIFGKNAMSCYDMSMTITPAMILVSFALVVYTIAAMFEFAAEGSFWQSFDFILKTLKNTYLTILFFGVVTTITEWKNIHTSWVKKILYNFTLPFFMITYIPISISAIFKKVEWKPIEHTESKDLDEIANKSA